jgi:glycosyltransferase involved in cell wall biosynthesis
MRILHLNSLYPPHILGGAERSVALLAEAQARCGHQVAAACISPDGWRQETLNDVEIFRMPHENDYWMEDWPNHPQGRREWAKFKQQFNVAIERHFGRVIDQFRPDIVNSHSLVDISTRVWRAAHRRGVPIVHTLREYDLLCGTSSMFRESGPCPGRHLKCVALTFAKQFDQRLVTAVTSVSAGVLERHRRHGFFSHVAPDRRRVIWSTAEALNGVTPVRPLRADGDFVIGFLGRISPEKGLDVLLKACRRLPPNGWRLKVGGVAAGNAGEISALAEGLPVDFLGFAEPWAFFESIDLLVVPSVWADPLPRTVLEAYAAGVPVLGSRCGGVVELVQDEVWLTSPGDVGALSARLADVINAGRQALPGPQAFARVVRETGAETVCHRFLDLYREVLSSSGQVVPPTAPHSIDPVRLN